MTDETAGPAGLNLAQRIYRARIERGWSQTEAARHFGMSQPAYGKWESGEHRPSPAKLEAVAKFVGLSVREVYNLKHGLPLSQPMAGFDEVLELWASAQERTQELNEAAVEELTSLREVVGQLVELVVTSGRVPAGE